MHLQAILEAIVAAARTVAAPKNKAMQGNKGRDTKPELKVRRLLRDLGHPGYRLQWKKAPGKPDIAFPGRRIAIFVNGCFWWYAYSDANPGRVQLKYARLITLPPRRYTEHGYNTSRSTHKRHN
jgi:DNA mismatch endonuclease Vsr